MYNNSHTRGWEKLFFMLLSKVLDIRGWVCMGGGIPPPPPTMGTFFGFGGY